MGPTKLALFSLMSSWPMVGKLCRTKIAEHLLQALDKVEKDFTSPVVRFVDNIAYLGDALRSFDYALEEDLRLYKVLRITTFTKTSHTAYTLLERLKVEGAPPNFEDYFKETVNPLPQPLLDWYSNEASLAGFINNAILLLHEYSLVNTPSGDRLVYKGTVPTTRFGTLEFFKSRYFKLLVLDLIQSLRIVLNLEVRGHHGKGQTRA